MRTKGRWAAILTACAALPVAGAAAFVARDRIAEEWWLFRLGSRDDAVRISAARHLAEARCQRAAPRFLRALEEDAREKYLGPHGIGGVPRTTRLTPIAFCLHRLGPEATETVRKRLEAHEEKTEAARKTSKPGETFDLRFEFLLHAILDAWRDGGEVIESEYEEGLPRRRVPR